LIEQTDFSIALPPALSAVKANCVSVSDQLQTGAADEPLVANEKQIEHDLADLLDTFKQLASNPGPPSDCRGCKGNKNKLLAELKVLRLLQSKVNDKTTQTDSQRSADAKAIADPDADMRQKITGIRDSQEDIHVAADKIHHELSGN
jgi:hypothetical protein